MKITFDCLGAFYGRQQVLQDVSFCAPSGQLTALVGRNGAGKTTLTRCLTGEKRDYSGTILLDDLPLGSLPLSRRAELVACLPQNLPRPHVTVRELVRFGRTPHTPFGGRLSAEDREAIDRAMEATGLCDLSEAFVDTLSGGERKKAFFAMTLAQDTPVVVLDEPTAHLDMVSRFEFLQLLQTMGRTGGKTMLIIMHELTDVLRWADRIVVLSDSKIVFDGTADACLEQEIPQEYFRIRISGDRKNGYSAVPAL